MMAIPSVLIAQSAKGGCGKTTIVDAVVAGLMAGAAKVLVIDADDGNSGYIRRCGKTNVVALSWATGADHLPAWWSDHKDGWDFIVIDCGANLVASAAPVNGFLGELVMTAAEEGGAVIPMAITSTNAPGTDRLVGQMRDAYGSVAKVRLIKNDQDGSGNFHRSLSTVGMPTAQFSHVRPGVQAARLLKVAPLFDVMRQPPEGYAVAMAMYARHVFQFMTEPAVCDIFSDEARVAVGSMSKKAPDSLAKIVGGLIQAGDAALTANHATMATRSALRQAARNPDNLAAIGTAALAWLKAENAYHDLIR